MPGRKNFLVDDNACWNHSQAFAGINISLIAALNVSYYKTCAFVVKGLVNKPVVVGCFLIILMAQHNRTFTFRFYTTCSIDSNFPMCIIHEENTATLAEKTWLGAQWGRTWEAQCPGRRITGGRRKDPAMSQVLSSIQYIYSKKTLGFKHGGDKLVSCPGCHLPSVRLWPWRFQTKKLSRRSKSGGFKKTLSITLIMLLHCDFIAKQGNTLYSKALLQPLLWKDISTNYKALLLSKLAFSDFRGISKPFVECTLLWR